MPRRVVNIKAVRYEAFVSGDLSRADIQDNVGVVSFILLDMDELVELGILLEGALETMEWGKEPPDPGRRFSIRVSGNRKRAYVTDHETGRLMMFPARENLTELRELLERVTNWMGGPTPR